MAHCCLSRCYLPGKEVPTIKTDEVSGACILPKGDVQATSQQLNVIRKYMREYTEYDKQNPQGDSTEICRC